MVHQLKDKTDAQIHEDVLQELHRVAHVNETEVGVQVDQGVVTLTGSVGSYAKKKAILGVTGHAPGIHAVEYHLLIKPAPWA